MRTELRQTPQLPPKSTYEAPGTRGRGCSPWAADFGRSAPGHPSPQSQPSPAGAQSSGGAAGSGPEHRRDPWIRPTARFCPIFTVPELRCSHTGTRPCARSLCPGWPRCPRRWWRSVGCAQGEGRAASELPLELQPHPHVAASRRAAASHRTTLQPAGAASGPAAQPTPLSGAASSSAAAIMAASSLR